MLQFTQETEQQDDVGRAGGVQALRESRQRGAGMAFRRCESCDGLIASRATVCPHCDVVLTETELLMPSPDSVSGSGTWIALLFFLIALVILADATGMMN